MLDAELGAYMANQRQNSIVQRISVGFCLRWTIANAIGYGLGLIIGLAQADRVDWILYWDFDKYGRAETGMLFGYIYNVIPGFFLSFALGLAYWIVLRDHVSRNGQWAVVTALGTMIGFVLAEFMGVPVISRSSGGWISIGGAVETPAMWLRHTWPWSTMWVTRVYIGGLYSGFVIGLIVAFMQWWSTECSKPLSWLWMIVSPLAMAFAFFAGTIMSFFSLDLAVVSVGIGTVYGLFTSAYLYIGHWRATVRSVQELPEETGGPTRTSS